ncbi:prefoldin subunit 6 isoform X2 [Musa acuminata AAA Group]|uniref:prefoldin subunit 6 isoform X2 n=1 Tax=Musa acuminata AAA Group TaxID=214697 RepID=UPI0031DF8D8B
MASSPAAVRELQQDLESQANALSKIQKDIAKNHQELELLNENSNVYKLIGPVLVKQDIAEANANVRKRIEYISVELKRLDGTLQDSEDKQNSKKESVLQLQQKIQTLQAGKSKSYLPFVRTVQSFYLLSSSGYSSMLFPVKTFLPC